MRIFVVLFFLLSVSCFAQTESDTIEVAPSPEWSSPNYSQEDKIFNRSIWTFVDNPALAGFDRKLAVAYRFRMKNLSMGVPNDEGNLELAFMKHEAFLDLPFGGPKQNWGGGVYYSHEKELQHTYHRIEMARSLRIQFPKSHNLILGLSIGVQFSKLDDWDKLTFGDMFDPRLGMIYQTQEMKPVEGRVLTSFNAGARYYWKRFSFDYAFQSGPNGAWALAGMSTRAVVNKLRTAYHIKAGDAITVSPELVAEITTTYISISQADANMQKLKATNNFLLFSAYATISYKDIVFAQLGMADLNRITLGLGYQLKDMLVIQVGASSYFDRTMQKIGGMASVDAGIRYQIKPWYR